ncbi:MAG: RecQ family ATP-dependent DNA helicase [Candidatus Pacebacteria bacterium]|jgi:ATP-dependent DNA helicase RecQ|nr:RecQ family ATP-dependent DNA helicase [Candidatus Paceibacterota bacterium]MBT3511685.1 RecQ family ATP-dependent DNA helicase [Candidatus Paceibacterota bacterium]MBT4005348.1 RecQ family ATP-dependent DNA helicase [Candidatus Paceibacterota bacterium]MBT4358680.1 RecQ family ATP-dependent DNA helicase [Candidatus Paceibacterota bacterium]MBT4681181.1 RecQ family ATP-dependent DNA helicase [Candidatus Paceibacterota bacterium]
MTPQQTLQKYFGFDNFRVGQLDIINSIISKKDVLAILPTGGGKSICFQIPGLVMPGTTLVISPLISLMKDQVDALLKKNIAATYINSSLKKEEKKNRLKQLSQQKYKFVYVAPERLQATQLKKICQQIKISLVAVDEAHCISMWGHDFRPEYTQINQFINSLPTQPTVAAFTATATQEVRTDIISSLELNQAQVFLNSFKRDNLSFHATTCHDNFSQELALFIILKKHLGQAGIIYTTTQKKAEYVAKLIKHYWGDDFPISAYHAGLETKIRAHIQDQFLNNQLRIITATNAFGMGVDKSNVRWIIHYQVSGSLENYYQEAGRAGRDQQPANCYLLFNPADLEIQKGFVNKAHPNEDDQLRIHQLAQLQQVINYTRNNSCRQQFILNYFDEDGEACGQCDLCQYIQLKPSAADQDYYQFLSQVNLDLKNIVFTKKLMQLLSIHRPLTKDEFLKIPGVGKGWVERWYNLVSKILEERSNHVHDTQTTYS